VLFLNLLLVAGLVVVGFSANSLGVLAAGGDYLADAAAIGVSLLAIWLVQRPSTDGRSRRYAMATTWAAGVNAGWLLVLNSVILVASVHRLAAGPGVVDALPVLIVSGIAAVVMLVGALILRGHGDADDADLNMRAVLLDTAADAAAAGGVAIAGAVILATHGFFWLDPAVAGAIALVVGFHAARLLLHVITALRNPPGAK